MSYIRTAVECVGGASKLAERIHVPVQSVYFWLSGERRIPAEHCPAIERETHHAVVCEDLRPDVDWAVLRGTKRRRTQQTPAVAAIKTGAVHG